MYGRSLVRALDIGVIAIVTIAVSVLAVLAWTTRQMDHGAFEIETTILNRHLGQSIADFRGEMPQEPAQVQAWLAARPQDRALLRGTAEGGDLVFQPGARITQLLTAPGAEARLREAFEAFRKFDSRRQRVDFMPLGTGEAQAIGLIARLPEGAGGDGLLVSMVDLAALALDLEAFAITLQPGLAVDAPQDGAQGAVQLAGFSGDVVATLRWTSRRISASISNYVYPALSGILFVGLVVMLFLRRNWAIARDGFLRQIRAVEAVALTDTLTGLPNRRALFEHFRVIEAGGGLFEPTTLLILDLSGLKWVNDVLGYRVGDQMVIRSAAVFADMLGEGVFLARLGGDAFVALLPGSLAEEALQALHGEISARMKARVLVDQSGAQIGVNIGAVSSAVSPGPCEALLRLADIALSVAKRAPAGSALVYAPSMREEKLARRKIERELADAIDQDEIFLAHQPIVDALDPARVLGHESLVRWRHPERGVIPPSVFIPVAEQSDLIVRLGNLVLDKALAELGPLGTGRISVNATGRQLLSPGFVDFVAGRLAHHAVAPARLCIELTETSLIEDGDGVAGVIDALRGLGIATAIDDFGTGYSSLGHLLRFKFDILKIDRDFVVNLDDKPESPMIVTAVVALARSLGMVVVGEGIETPAQQRFLAAAGCNALQGYLFGRPVALPELVASTASRPDPAGMARVSGFQAA
jgi:diguanylate cyclase (GGDEF)-like protein